MLAKPPLLSFSALSAVVSSLFFQLLGFLQAEHVFPLHFEVTLRHLSVRFIWSSLLGFTSIAIMSLFPPFFSLLTNCCRDKKDVEHSELVLFIVFDYF